MARVLITTLVLSNPTISWANEIYVRQVGHEVDLDIIQDGDNNKIRSLNTTSGDAVLSGNDKTVSLTQEGVNNRIGIWSSGNDQTITVVQKGDSNVSAVDNHGNDNTINVDIEGDSNVTHTEIGNGGDEDNTLNVTVHGDSNNVYTEVLNGDDNAINVQIRGHDNNINRVIVNGNDNEVTAWQGRHENGSIDANETGDNDVYWIVTGNNNELESYQTDDNNNGGQHIANYITGDDNVVNHTQRGSGDHKGYIEIGGDGNNVTLLQRGNGALQNMFADIVLDDGHTLDITQRHAAHTTNIDFTNGGGAYNLTLSQMSSSTQTYNMTGTCTNANGCALTVNQN